MLFNYFHDEIQEMPVIEDYVGYWATQSSTTADIVCSQFSDGIVQCLWPNSNRPDKLRAHNLTINGLTVICNNPTKTGNYTGNGVIMWEGGDTWTKQGKLFGCVGSQIST